MPDEIITYIISFISDAYLTYATFKTSISTIRDTHVVVWRPSLLPHGIRAYFDVIPYVSRFFIRGVL